MVEKIWLKVSSAVLCIGVFVLTPSLLWAQKVSDPSSVTTETITIKNKSFTIRCFNGKGGVLNKAGTKFTNFAKRAKVFAAKRKSASNTKQQKKFQKRSKLERQKNKAAKSACAGSSGGGGGNSGGGGGSPTSYFNVDGTMNASGLQRFEIPTGLSADVVRGEGLYNSNSCDGCHGTRGQRLTFSDLRSAVESPSMGFTEDFLSNADLADILAYINRFAVPPQ